MSLEKIDEEEVGPVDQKESPKPEDQSLTPDSVVKVAPDVLFSEVQGEAVLLNVKTGIYFGLNQVGTSIWNSLEESVTLRVLQEKLVEQYEASPERVWTDLSALIGNLHDRSLAEVDSLGSNTG